MKKHTYEELMSMDLKALEELDDKTFRVANIMGTESRATGQYRNFTLTPYEIRDMVRSGVIGVSVCFCGYLGYRAVKYYTDKTAAKNLVCGGKDGEIDVPDFGNN